MNYLLYRIILLVYNKYISHISYFVFILHMYLHFTNRFSQNRFVSIRSIFEFFLYMFYIITFLHLLPISIYPEYFQSSKLRVVESFENVVQKIATGLNLHNSSIRLCYCCFHSRTHVCQQNSRNLFSYFITLRISMSLVIT